jgi:hypothetical protein
MDVDIPPLEPGAQQRAEGEEAGGWGRPSGTAEGVGPPGGEGRGGGGGGHARPLPPALPALQSVPGPLAARAPAAEAGAEAGAGDRGGLTGARPFYAIAEPAQALAALEQARALRPMLVLYDSCSSPSPLACRRACPGAGGPEAGEPQPATCGLAGPPPGLHDLATVGLQK